MTVTTKTMEKKTTKKLKLVLKFMMALTPSWRPFGSLDFVLCTVPALRSWEVVWETFYLLTQKCDSLTNTYAFPWSSRYRCLDGDNIKTDTGQHLFSLWWFGFRISKCQHISSKGNFPTILRIFLKKTCDTLSLATKMKTQDWFQF